MANTDRDETGDSADFGAISACWKEMSDFLTRCEAEGPPKTKRDEKKRNAEFLAIQKRCNEAALQIFYRANESESDSPPKVDQN